MLSSLHGREHSEQKQYGSSLACPDCRRLATELSTIKERCQALEAANSSLLAKLGNRNAMLVQNSPPAMARLRPSPQETFIRRLVKEMATKLEVATHALEPNSEMLVAKKILGEGNFGKVTLEWCQTTERHYAVKRPVGDQGVAGLRREVHALMNIPAHQHLVSVEAIWDGYGTHMALAMEAADYNMHHALKGTRHSCSDLLCLMVDVCRGVSHLHNKGFVHCDLKLSNILLKQVGHLRYAAKVADFGLVHAIGEERQPNTGAFGVIPFENFQTRVRADPVQDVFSVGVMVLSIMMEKKLVQQNMFCHEMLWSEQERQEFEGLASEEMKKRFLIDLSFRKMADTGDSGFGKTMIQPANLQPLHPFHKEYACKKLRTMVHSDPAERPNVESIMKFANTMANSTRRAAMITTSSPRTPAGAPARGTNGSTDDEDDSSDDENDDDDKGDNCTCVMGWEILWTRVMGWLGRTNRVV